MISYVDLTQSSSSTMLIISAFRNACQGLIFLTYISFWVLDVSKPLISPQQVLQWMVARAPFKWEELRVAPCPPLNLSISQEVYLGNKVIFSFDGE
jgi:hypothetical protein